MRYLLLIVALSCATVLSAQFPQSENFRLLADSLKVYLDSVPAGTFKLKPSPKNDYLADDLTTYAKSEKLELRLALRPENERSLYYQRPHMEAAMLVMNLSSNDEDAVTTVHSFEEEEMAVLNADWARMWTFRPKRSFANYATAQLVATYRRNRGLAYTILLFDKAPGTVEDRQLVLRWR